MPHQLESLKELIDTLLAWDIFGCQGTDNNSEGRNVTEQEVTLGPEVDRLLGSVNYLRESSQPTLN
jgi:hypothetical protein